MKPGWIMDKLENVCEKITDGTHQTPTYFEKGILFLSSRNVTGGVIDWDHIKYIDEKQHLEMYKRVAPRINDILLAKNGTTGVAAKVDREITFDIYVSLALLRARDEILPDYLLYFINSPIAKNQFNKRLKGVGVPNLHLEEIREVLVPFPKSLVEQKRIVGILDEAFEGIATAKANAEKNLQNARALFENNLQNIFSRRGPEYVEKLFSEVCTITSMLVDPRQKMYLDLLHVGGANIETKTGKLIELKTAREEKLISGKFLFDENMVLYSKIRPYLMKVARPTFKGLCSADIYPLSVMPSELDQKYLYHLLLSPEFTEYAIEGSARAGMPKVNREHLFAYTSWFPPLKEQRRLAKTLDALFEETQKLESVYKQKHDALEDLKKSLLNQAFTGQL
jgi:type I restriction enzyme S subunit